MKPLKITAFWDGTAGHEKQTRGILQAMERMTPIQVTDVKLEAVSTGRKILNWLAYFKAVFFHPALENKNMQPDLIIGTGTSTHIPMLMHKKQSSARVVTSMTPDPLVRGKFDLCFVPLHDNQKPGENIFFTSGPPSTARCRGVHDLGKGLILVGGIDKKSHVWEGKAILKKIAAIVDRSKGISWTISSSPRTPGDTIILLENYSEKNHRTVFFRSQDTPMGWIEDAYDRNKMVWVTADSVSMLFEALAAGCMVGVIPVKWKKRKNKFQASIDHLAAEGRVTTYEGWIAGDEMAEGKPLDEASRCAGEILRRWWPGRLEAGPAIPEETQSSLDL